MKMLFERFLKDESGAVTVDWVVLTAAIVGIGIAVFAAVRGELINVANDIGDDMASQINSDGTADRAYDASN